MLTTPHWQFQRSITVEMPIYLCNVVLLYDHGSMAGNSRIRVVCAVKPITGADCKPQAPTLLVRGFVNRPIDSRWLHCSEPSVAASPTVGRHPL